VEARVVHVDAIARSFAEAAQLEAASVVAFEQLAEQLEGWGGAPVALVERCRSAAQDEVRHAEIMRGFARRHGAEVPPVLQVADASSSSLLEAALHNATEGCVSETWAALLAHHQAAHAEDPALRRAYATIAEDETRHAQLAWDLHAWFCSQLDAAGRAAVERARAEALSELWEMARAQADLAPAGLGLPERELAARTARVFARRLAA
jgi:hypothetical protein